MGHACAVFDDKIWVLGGLSADNYPLEDVWTCEVKNFEDPDNLEWKEQPELKLKQAGCMFAVLATPKADKRFGEARLWVYGGANHPYSLKPFSKLWYIKPRPHQSQSYAEWTSLQFPKLGEPVPDPVGAGLLYTEGTLRIAGRFQNQKGACLLYTSRCV